MLVYPDAEGATQKTCAEVCEIIAEAPEEFHPVFKKCVAIEVRQEVK